jgi:hypothetical protein
MIINKLDLLSKGWNTSEIEHASKILGEEEDSKGRIKFVDMLRIFVLVLLMLANGFICSELLVPFVYVMPIIFLLMLAAIIGFAFSILFTLLVYDMEKINHKHETNLFIAFIASGIVNFYLIVEFAAQFGIKTKLPLTQNIYLIAGVYFIAFLIPQLTYQMTKKREI